MRNILVIDRLDHHLHPN